jgi:NitT/TauT family transport system substrate-binding protein
MRTQHARPFSRRAFLGGLTLAGTAGLLGVHPDVVAAEPPPETTTVRLSNIPAVCLAPQFVAEELLKADGFTVVQYVKIEDTNRSVASGEVDFGSNDAPGVVMGVDAGDALVALAGIHTGCFELFATDRVRSLRDLKGSTVAVPFLGSGRHAFVASMAASVGLDPRKDIAWVVHPPAESMRLLADEKIDAYLGFPPDPQELRAKKIGHVLVDTRVDRPWSQYFCCLVTGNRAFVRKHPVATKRVVRAILKAATLCALEPEQVGRLLVEKGYASHYDYAVQMLKELPYGRWREYNPEETVRFYALRLNEVGMIKSTPQKIIGQGTDWRFVNELKKELKE